MWARSGKVGTEVVHMNMTTKTLGNAVTRTNINKKALDIIAIRTSINTNIHMNVDIIATMELDITTTENIHTREVTNPLTLIS